MGRMSKRFGMRAERRVRLGDARVGPGGFDAGAATPLLIGHGLFMGLLGIGAINAPMYVYISQWFDRRRGSALALISSGCYLAGALWPPVFERVITRISAGGTTMLCTALRVAVVVPLALVFLKKPPGPRRASDGPAAARGPRFRIALPPNARLRPAVPAGVLCCVPMAMPQQHMVAFCGDLGISRATGALLLSVLLGTAFFSRQVGAVVSDRLGGLKTIFICSGAQAVALTAFLFTQSEAGLFLGRRHASDSASAPSSRPTRSRSGTVAA